MSIEFIEETDNLKGSGEFLPPVVTAVRRSGRGVFAIVASALFALASLCLLICDFVAGAIFVPVSLLLLSSWLVNFKKSKELRGSYGLRFQKTAYLISAVVLAALSALDKFEVTNRYIWKFSSLFNGLTELVPDKYRDIVNCVFSGADTVAACLALCFLCIALSLGSLNRSNAQNLPFTKTLFMSVLVNSALGVINVGYGLIKLNLLIPRRCPLEGIKPYLEATLFFIFAVVLILFAVWSLITYIKMSKVKNAVLKA